MGEYYNWINIEKKEYICPALFGYGSKYWETAHKDSIPTHAMYDLLSGRWKEDHILWFDDECPISIESPYGIIRELYRQTVEYGEPGIPFDMICETYRNISGLFVEAEKRVREEIGNSVEDQKNGTGFYEYNEFGIDIGNPYEGLFTERIHRYKYTINHTKNIAYSIGKTKIYYQSGKEIDFADPITNLLGFGRVEEPGAWIGDIVGVADDLPEGYSLLEKVVLNWG